MLRLKLSAIMLRRGCAGGEGVGLHPLLQQAASTKGAEAVLLVQKFWM